MTAAIIAAIILGNKPGMGQLSEATLMGAAAGGIQKQINFTRSNELEADRIGSQTLSQSGYAADAMQRFFTRLLQNNQYQEDSSLEFLRTHPLTVNRIAQSNRLPLTSSRPSSDKQQPGKRSIFLQMQHRVRVLTSKMSMQLIAFYDHIDMTNPDDQYGKALARIYDHKYEDAQHILSTLIAVAPDNLSYILATIENEVFNGSTKRALLLIENKLHLYPNDPPLTMLHVKTLIKDGQYAQAKNILRQYTYNVDINPQVYALLAEAEGKYGDISATHQALAEFYFLNGDSEAALKQIDLALEQEQKMQENERARLQSRRKEIRLVIDAEAR
jgi:predicted Zn-dependent protease